MKEKTCCFTGHRQISDENIKKVKKYLEIEIKELISKGVLNFICGGALGFDTLAAQTIISLGRKNNNIKLILAIPCHGQHKYWEDEDKKIYEKIYKKASEVVYISNLYYNGCMQKRNRYLVDNSAYCIAYLEKSTGGTAYTVSYARKKGLKIINLFDK